MQLPAAQINGAQAGVLSECFNAAVEEKAIECFWHLSISVGDFSANPPQFILIMRRRDSFVDLQSLVRVGHIILGDANIPTEV